MQRRAAAAYAALFVIVATAAFVPFATAGDPPSLSLDADRELTRGDSVTANGTTYTVTGLSRSGEGGPSATIEWSEGGENKSVTVKEGGTVSLGDTEYVGHFEGGTLQLVGDAGAYNSAMQSHQQRQHAFWAIIVLSGSTAVVLLGAAYLPSRRD